jgi:hypothetical protein
VAVLGWSAWLRWVNPMIMMNIIIIIISIITQALNRSVLRGRIKN